MVQIVIVPNATGTPAGKLADAEVQFTGGTLAGLTLVGFALWESQWPDRRTGGYVRVTVPSREYVNAAGETKRFNLLRPMDRDHDQPALDGLTDAILDAYYASEGQVHEAEQVVRQVARASQVPPARRRAVPPVPHYAPPPGARRAAPVPVPVPVAPRTAAPARTPTGQRWSPAPAPVKRAVSPDEPPPPTDDDNYPF